MVLASRRMTRRRAALSAPAAAVLALGAAACGGGGARQDAGERSATYTVEVTRASFPAEQRLARPSQMRIAVKNTGAEALPGVAVTVDSFSRRSEQPGLADSERPIWIVDESPGGATTALTDTWALGPLPPDRTRTFRWRLSPVEAGRYTLRYTIAAGLGGRARVRSARGASPPTGTFAVRISPRPSAARVDPVTGAVVRTG